MERLAVHILYSLKQYKIDYKQYIQKIFDEILDRGHLDSDEQVGSNPVLNGSIIDEEEDRTTNQRHSPWQAHHL